MLPISRDSDFFGQEYSLIIRIFKIYYAAKIENYYPRGKKKRRNTALCFVCWPQC